jgi:hypothetical protein
MLTLGALKDLARHAIGGAADSRVDLDKQVNAACRKLVHARAWSWRLKIANVAAVANQDYIAMPADFDAPAGVPALSGGTGFGGVEMTTPQDIQRLRSYGASVAGGYRVAFGVYADDLAAHMQVYPTPTANGNPTFSISYLRRWVDISGDGTSAVIPDPYELAILYRVRGQVRLLEDDTDGGFFAMYDREIAELWEEDAQRRMHISAPTGGSLLGRVDEGRFTV